MNGQEAYPVRFSAAELTAEIASDSPLLGDYFRWKTALLATDAPPDVRLRVRVCSDPSSESETGDGAVCLSPEQADRLIEKSSMLSAHLAAAFSERSTALLHAAGLARGERGLLIAGFPGTGKTTLTAACMERGFGYLSDDTLFLRDGIVWPVESTIHPERDMPGPFSDPGLPFYADPGTDHKRHLDLSLKKELFVRRAQVAMLLFLNLPRSPRPETGPISPAAALTMLLSSASRLMGGDRAYRALLQKELSALRGLPAFLFTPGPDPEENAEYIDKLFDGGSSCTD